MPVTRREFLLSALGASLGACTTQRIMRRPVSPRPVPTIAVCVHPDYRKLIPSTPELVKVLSAFAAVYNPIWGTNCNIVAADHPVQVPGVWNFVFAEDALECEGALAYHDWDPSKGINPYALIEVPASLHYDHNVTVAATHELAEMLADPGCSYWADPVPLTDEDERDPQKMLDTKLFAYETADPVENATFQLLGHPVTDFVYPAYFEPFADGRVDHVGAISKPLQIAVGGYQIVRSSTDVRQVVNIGFGPDEMPEPDFEEGCGGKAPVNPTNGKPLCHRARRILAKYGR